MPLGEIVSAANPAISLRLNFSDQFLIACCLNYLYYLQTPG